MGNLFTKKLKKGSTCLRHKSSSSSKHKCGDADDVIQSSHGKEASSSAEPLQNSSNFIRYKNVNDDDGKKRGLPFYHSGLSFIPRKPQDLLKKSVETNHKEAKAQFLNICFSIQRDDDVEFEDFSTLNDFGKYLEGDSTSTISLNPLTNGISNSVSSSSNRSTAFLIQISDDVCILDNIKDKAYKDELIVDYYIFSYIREFHSKSFEAIW